MHKPGTAVLPNTAVRADYTHTPAPVVEDMSRAELDTQDYTDIPFHTYALVDAMLVNLGGVHKGSSMRGKPTVSNPWSYVVAHASTCI